MEDNLSLEDLKIESPIEETDQSPAESDDGFWRKAVSAVQGEEIDWTSWEEKERLEKEEEEQTTGCGKGGKK